MIDRVDTNEQGRVIIAGFREYRNPGLAHGARFPPRCTKLSGRNHIISTFVTETSAIDSQGFLSLLLINQTMKSKLCEQHTETFEYSSGLPDPTDGKL